MSLLDNINSPQDLRKLAPDQLEDLSREVRNLIVNVISQSGGHFASNLGTVELAVALHYVFDTPKDKLIWDVSHQAYPHKILTGRKDRLHTIRKMGGISGFTCREESEFDHFGAGHASTSISAALGMAEAMRHSGQDNMAVAIIGDGALTGGLAFEALNNAGHIPARNLVVIFNDNDMSIDPSVGALNQFINHTVTHPGYNRFRKEIRTVLDSLSTEGLPLLNLAQKLRHSLKNFFTPGVLFECFGFRYFGPIDGHNVDELRETLAFIKKEGSKGGPYLIHALTTKGKGYRRAEELPLKYHGVQPFKVEEGMVGSPGPKKVNYQDVFAETLIRMTRKDPRIMAVTAAMPSGTGLVKYQKEFPTHCYDVGIAEGHAVLFAAGLATAGYRPVAAIYSTFLQRAYDQIIHDVALQKLPVIFAMDRAGLVGADGATHQGQFDLAYLRTIPHMVIMAPKDENELQHMIKTSVSYEEGPIALRYPRGEVVGVPLDSELKNLPIGEAELIHSDGDELDVLLVAIGYSVQATIEAQKLIQEKGFRTGVINARFVKPLDEKLLRQWITRSKIVVTVEENSIQGGFGSAVLEAMQRWCLFRETLLLGIPDRFIDHASPKQQREICGIDGPGIAERVLARLEARKSSPLTPKNPTGQGR